MTIYYPDDHTVGCSYRDGILVGSHIIFQLTGPNGLYPNGRGSCPATVIVEGKKSVVEFRWTGINRPSFAYGTHWLYLSKVVPEHAVWIQDNSMRNSPYAGVLVLDD